MSGLAALPLYTEPLKIFVPKISFAPLQLVIL